VARLTNEGKAVAIRRTLLAAAMLASMSGERLVAGDYIVEIAGAPGIVFGGTCLLVTADKNANYPASGSPPLTLRFSGDLISCAIQRKAGTGTLRIVIRNAAGHVVAESSKVLPFGVLIAGGR
jgi:hypothetical protein